MQNEFLQQKNTGSNSIVKIGKKAEMHVWLKLCESSCYLLL